MFPVPLGISLAGNALERRDWPNEAVLATLAGGFADHGEAARWSQVDGIYRLNIEITKT